MPGVALAVSAAYLAVVFGWRTWWQIRATGSSGFHGISGSPRTPEWWGGVLFVAALAVGLAAPVLQIAGVLEPVAAVDGTVGRAVGGAFVLAGALSTVLAQRAMGVAWRIGVDTQERTELVTSGLFAVVRNPVFTAMVLAAAGIALLAPNPAAIGAVVLLVLAIELQVRGAEEPYLAAVHGDAYARYAASVGRLVPGVGRR